MRRLVVAAFSSLDGVMQAPGAPQEDPTGGFVHGGWIVPQIDDVVGSAIDESFSAPFDLLLGRNTYDIFAAYWPYVPTDPTASGFDARSADIARKFGAVTKYVATHRPETLKWQNSQALGSDVLAAVRKLKQQDGPALLTQGSADLIHTLLAHDVVDELRVYTFPLLLGKGKRLFDAGTMPATLQLTKSVASTKGAIIATYERAGEVKLGAFTLDHPSPEELDRRKNLR